VSWSCYYGLVSSSLGLVMSVLVLRIWSCSHSRHCKLSPPTNHHRAFYRLDDLSITQPTVSMSWRENTLQVETKARNTCVKVTEIQITFTDNSKQLFTNSHETGWYLNSNKPFSSVGWSTGPILKASKLNLGLRFSYEKVKEKIGKFPILKSS